VASAKSLRARAGAGMSTEKIALQPLGKYAEEDEEKSASRTLPEKLKELERSDAESKPKTRKATLMGIFITLMTLLGYVFLNGAISMISPFYPIVVSFYILIIVYS